MAKQHEGSSFPQQGLNLCPQQWKRSILRPLDHQASPQNSSLKVKGRSLIFRMPPQKTLSVWQYLPWPWIALATRCSPDAGPPSLHTCSSTATSLLWAHDPHSNAPLTVVIGVTSGTSRLACPNPHQSLPANLPISPGLPHGWCLHPPALSGSPPSLFSCFHIQAPNPVKSTCKVITVWLLKIS